MLCARSRSVLLTIGHRSPNTIDTCDFCGALACRVHSRRSLDRCHRVLELLC